MLYPGEKAKSRRDARRQAEAETNAKRDTYADALIQAGAVQPKKTGIGWIDNLMRTDTPIEETDQRVRARHAAKNLVEAEDAQAAMDKERETAKASGLGSEDWYARSQENVDALNEQYREVNRQLQAERAKAQEGIFAGEFSYMFEDQRAAAEAKAKELEAQSKALEKQIEAANARLNYAGAMRWDDAMESEGFEAAAETGKADSRNKVRRAEKELSNEFYNPEKSEVDPDELRAAEFMSDSEKQIYDWLLASRGEEAADQYLAELSDTLNMRQGKQIAGEIEDMGRVGNFVNTVALAGATGVGNALKGLTQNLQSDAAPTSATDYAGQFVRQNLEYDDSPKIFGHSATGIAYDAINTMANMAPSLAVGAINPIAGAVTMSLSSKGNAYKRALDEGFSKGEAQVYSSVVGAAEGGLQYLLGGFSKLGGISQFTDAFTKSIGKAGLRAAAELGIDLFGENLEEYLQNKLDLYMRNNVFGENNEIKLWDEDDTYTVLLTTLTTALMNAGQTHNTVQTGKVGQAFYQSRNVDTLLDLAAQSENADVRTMAEDILSGKTKATDNNIGELAISFAQAGGDLSEIISHHATVDEAATEAAQEASVEQPTAAVEAPAPQRVPAKDFTPKPTTKWNPKSQRGKAEIKAARQLRRTFGLWNSSTEAAEAVHRVAESMRDRNRGSDVMDVARKAVDEMLQNQKSGVETGDRELYNRIRQYLNGTDIQISDELRGDITDFSAWKKNAMKKLRLRANSGQSIDSIYAELGQIAGEGVFPPDVYAHSDMIARILNTLDALKPQAVMMSEEFTGEAYDAIRDSIADELAKAAAETVGGKWKGYKPGESMGGKSEAAVRHEAIELEMEVAAMSGEDLPREEAARIVDERYIQYGVYNEAEVLAMEETEESESGTDETGEETETAPGDAAAETERPADTGAAEDGGTGVYGVAGRDVPAQRQTGEVTEQQKERLPREVERGFSENVRTDENMEQELRDDFTNDPDYYTQLSNKETLGKAQEIFNRGLDEARAVVDGALANAKAGKKLAPEIVPLARMVANELTRNGEKASARRILSDLAVELTQAGQLGQAAKILRATDAQTALKTVQKALDKINAEVQKKWGKRAKWKAELTEAEKTMLENIDMGDEAAYQDAYKQIAKRLGKEMPATLWEKITEFRRVNMLLKPRTQIRNVMANVPMVALRKGAETISGAIQDAMVKTGVMDKAEQTRTLKVSKETRNGAKEYFKANKDSILSEGNKWDINTALREYRTYFKDGKLAQALSKLTGKEQHNLMEQARRFTYDLLEKGDAPFVKSAFVDSLAEYMAAKGLSDFSNVPQEAVDFAMSNALEATFKNASTVANFINQVKRNGGAAGAAMDIVFPFTTTPLNITSLMLKYSPAGFGSAIYDALVKKANAPDIIDKASKATVGSAMFGLGVLLRSLGAITGKQDDDKDKAALDKATGKAAYSIGGRWSYDWAQPAGSLLALGAETWDAIQGQEKVSDAVMNALYSAGDSVLNMSLFQNVTSMLKGYGSNTQAILDSIIEGGGTQLVPGLAGDIAALIDDTVRSSYTGGNVLQDTLAKMGMNLPGISKTLPASVNVKGEENKRGPLWFRGLERLVDPGTYNRNEMTDSDRAIYDLYEDTGDKTIFPHVAPTKFDYDGETYRMTGDERAQFQTTQGQIYYEMLDAMLDSGEWDDMSRAAKVKMLQDAAAYAQDEAKRELVEARGGEYESSQYEKISNYADGDSELASQILSVRNEAKDAISKDKADILDRLLGKDGAYNELDDEAKELLNVDYIGKIVDMHDNGMDAAGALTVVNTIADLEPEGDHKSVTQQQKVDAIIGTDLTDKEKIAAIKTYTSDSYVEKMQAAIDSGVSLEKWSEVRNKYAEISDTEGLSAMQKATQFAAALDKDKSLTEKQRQVLREQLTYSSMSTAEAKRYDELTDTGMNIDTATKVTDILSSIKPLDGKTSVTQNQKVDAILNAGLKPADTWAALQVYTSESWYNDAKTAYEHGIDLDDYVTKSETADANGKNGISQAELYAFYMQNPKANEKYCKVMLMILNPNKDWDKFLREQARAAKKAG